MSALEPIAWLWKWEKDKGLWMGCLYDQPVKCHVERYLEPVVKLEDALNEIASLEYRLDEANQSNIQLFEAYNRLYSEWVQWVPEGYYAKEWVKSVEIKP